MAAPPARPPAQPAEEPKGRNWLLLGLLGGGGLVTACLVLWLLSGGMSTVMSLLPEGVVKALGERPGEGKRVEQHLTDYPGEKAADKDDAPPAAKPTDKPANPAPQPELSAEELATALQPLKDLGKAADTAIETVRENRAKNLDELHAAEKAVDAIRSFKSADLPKQARKAADEEKRALAAEKADALEAAKRLGKATHLVSLPNDKDTTPLREAASDASEVVASVDDGALVHVHLDTGKGWLRVDVLNGKAAGKGGYLPGKVVKKIP